MEPPGSAHSNPTSVLGCHSPAPGPVGKASAEGHPSMPPHRWYSLAGFGPQQGSAAQGRGTREGKAHRFVATAHRRWPGREATSTLHREASLGSSFTWHLVTVITAEL